MSEPVVLHHGLAEGAAGHDEARRSASTACWAARLSAGEVLAVKVEVDIREVWN